MSKVGISEEGCVSVIKRPTEYPSPHSPPTTYSDCETTSNVKDPLNSHTGPFRQNSSLSASIRIFKKQSAQTYFITSLTTLDKNNIIKNKLKKSSHTMSKTKYTYI